MESENGEPAKDIIFRFQIDFPALRNYKIKPKQLTYSKPKCWTVPFSQTSMCHKLPKAAEYRKDMLNC